MGRSVNGKLLVSKTSTVGSSPTRPANMLLCCIVNGTKYCLCGWRMCYECFRREAFPNDKGGSQEGADRLNALHKAVADAAGKACSRVVTYKDQGPYSSACGYDF